MDIWNDILQSLVICRQLTFLDVPDVLDENGYYLQIRGSRSDKSQVSVLFFVKVKNSEYLFDFLLKRSI